jgi:hypothetical protein
VGHHTEAFVGIDTSKSSDAIAIADGGRGPPCRIAWSRCQVDAGQICPPRRIARGQPPWRLRFRFAPSCWNAGSPCAI